jgi:hypothetical protein
VPENDWKISKPGEQCQKCGSVLGAGQPYYSALFVSQEGFARKDYCVDCFQNSRPSDIFYYWKSAAAKPEGADPRKRVAVDIENVLEFFKRLDYESDTRKIAFRYILALMLARKKVLLAGDRKIDARGQSVQLYSEKGGGPEHAVIEPELSAEEIQSMSAELGAVLGMQA